MKTLLLIVGAMISLQAMSMSSLPPFKGRVGFSSASLTVSIVGGSSPLKAVMSSENDTKVQSYWVIRRGAMGGVTGHPVTFGSFYKTYTQFQNFYNQAQKRITESGDLCARRIEVTLVESNKTSFHGKLCTELLLPKERKLLSQWYRGLK